MDRVHLLTRGQYVEHSLARFSLSPLMNRLPINKATKLRQKYIEPMYSISQHANESKGS
jgi:hypothetical protein